MSEHANIIARFGLRAPTSCYPATLAGLQGYLDELADGAGLHVTAKEVATPYHPEIAEKLYATPFLIPGSENIAIVDGDAAMTSWDFERFAAIWALLLPFRREDGRPLSVINWFRPDSYNAHPRVDGAKRSDHLTADAIDVGIRDASHRKALAKHLAQYRKDEELQLSLGVYTTRIHVGIRSPAGARVWGPNKREVA